MIIIFSLAIILSFLFNIIAKKTGVPSVILLILTGVLIQPLAASQGIDMAVLNPLLHLLGIVGIIFIVLEAALELKVSRLKIKLISRAFISALLNMVLCTLAFAFVFNFLFHEGIYRSILVSIPLATVSSAIVLPSLFKVEPSDKEFLIYESTFSDILGIMLFFLIIEIKESFDISLLVKYIGINVLVTLIFSILFSIFLAYLFQHIKAQVKLLLLIAVLSLFFAIGKYFHISTLLLILFFGLFLQNFHLLGKSFLARLFKAEVMHELQEDLHIITMEISFVVRTFFFIIFGMTATLTHLAKPGILLLGLLLIALIFLIRALVLWGVYKEKLKSGLWINPRGLITILLYFSIPEEYKLEGPIQDVILVVIFVSAILMSISLIKQGIIQKRKQEFILLDDEDIR